MLPRAPFRFRLHPSLLLSALVIVSGSAWVARGQPAYLDNDALARRVKELAEKHRDVVHADPACVTPRKNPVWRLELGRGKDDERRQRPGLLVVAGVEGNDQAGTVSAMGWVTSLAQGDATDTRIKRLLDTTTLYVWPRLNPDAARHYFAKPRVEVLTNDEPDDPDHDGLSDEDGPEDLDGDGRITWMRVADPQGDYILDPMDPRLLLKADPFKGERGAWRLLLEGRDNDGDERWNEDGPGGVNLNRNFPYGYKFFAPGSGRHQISETETRALADFVIGHPNIAAAFTFGAVDNLAQTPKGEGPKRPPVALHEEDVAWYRELGKAWREGLGLKKELTGNSEAGTFSDWIYYHRGRLSLAARPWSPPLQLELSKAQGKEDKPAKDAAQKETTKENAPKPDSPDDKDKGKASDNRNEEDRAFLKWIDQNATNAFVPWKRFEHPEFPGKQVEVGGFAPFARSNPPERMLADLSVKHAQFLTGLAEKLPRIAIRRVEVKHLGESVYDIIAHVENTGYFPTQLAQGGLTREVLPTRVILKVDPKNILSGTRAATLNAIQGHEAKEVRWIVRAKGEKKLDLEVVSALAGRVQTSVELQIGRE